jgi:hypothetical protein
MPNDPKWRTIARKSGRSISEVMAVYCHLLVMASSNSDRGHVDGITCHDMSRENVTNVTFRDLSQENDICHEINFLESLSTSLDLEIDHIESILFAMQGRVLDGAFVAGWEGRQPKREDAGANEYGPKSAAQRKREERARKKAETQNAGCHDASHSVTQCHDRLEEIREDLKSPPPPTREDNFDSRTKFAMTDAWEPDPDSFTTVLFRNGMAGQSFEANQLLEFRSFWIASPDEHRTHAKWEHALAQHLKQNLRNSQAHGGKPNETGGRTARGHTRNAHDILTDDTW